MTRFCGRIRVPVSNGDWIVAQAVLYSNSVFNPLSSGSRSRLMDAREPDNFYRRFRLPAEPGVPKYAQLRRAIIAAIEEGYWQPGAKLPTELELARLTPFSLGTVQRGLRALAEEGIIERRQGHGSFIAEPRHRSE